MVSKQPREAVAAVLQVSKIKARKRRTGVIAAFAPVHGDQVAGELHAGNG